MSKMTWIVVAVILTSSVVGVYRWQNASTTELELEKFADTISETVNRVFTTSGDFSINITFEPRDNSFLVLKDSFQGDPFTLNFTTRTLTITTADRSVTRRFLGELSLVDPFLMDKRHVSLPIPDNNIMIPSGQDFVIESKTIDGSNRVYLYPDDNGVSRTISSSLYRDLQDFIEWDGNYESVEYHHNVSFDHPLSIRTDHLYHSNRTPVPIGTPVLNLSDHNADPLDALEVPAGTELYLRRSLKQERERTFVDHEILEKSSSS